MHCTGQGAIFEKIFEVSPSLQKTGKIDHISIYQTLEMIRNEDQPVFEDLLLDASASSATHSLDLIDDVISAKLPSSDEVDHSSQEVILTEEDLERIYMFVQANVVSKVVRKMSDQKHEALPPPSRYVQRNQKHIVREQAQTMQTAFKVELSTRLSRHVAGSQPVRFKN